MNPIHETLAKSIEKLTQGIIRAFMQQRVEDLQFPEPPKPTPRRKPVRRRKAQPKPAQPKRLYARMTQEKGKMVFFFHANGRTYRAGRRRDLARQARKLGLELDFGLTP